MTDPVLTIETTRLSVEPGGQVQTTLTVQNPGEIVEGYKLTVIGPGAEGWGQVMPDEVQVYPGQETTAVLVFNPPSDAAAGSGTFPFGIKAASVVDDDTSVVAEGDLDLGRVFGLQAKLSPVASTGRWSGQHLVQFTNWGNAPVRLKLAAADPDEKLAFLLHPDVIDVPIGATTPTALRVKTKKPFLRGQPVRLPFSISAEPDPPEPAAMGPAGPLPVMADPRRAQVDGAFNQRPILSKWVILLALLLLAVIALLIVLAVRRTPPPPPSAALGAGVPAIPSALTVTGTGETSITVGWDEQPGMESFRLYTLTADGKKSAVNELDGNLSQAPVENLQPGSQYCFRLQAVRGGKPSDLSEQACGNTVAVPVHGVGERADGHPDRGRTGADHRTGDRAVRSATVHAAAERPRRVGSDAAAERGDSRRRRTPEEFPSRRPVAADRTVPPTGPSGPTTVPPTQVPTDPGHRHGHLGQPLPAEQAGPGDRDCHPGADGAADGPHRTHRPGDPRVHQCGLDRVPAAGDREPARRRRTRRHRGQQVAGVRPVGQDPAQFRLSQPADRRQPGARAVVPDLHRPVPDTGGGCRRLLRGLHPDPTQPARLSRPTGPWGRSEPGQGRASTAISAIDTIGMPSDAGA